MDGYSDQPGCGRESPDSKKSREQHRSSISLQLEGADTENTGVGYGSCNCKTGICPLGSDAEDAPLRLTPSVPQSIAYSPLQVSLGRFCFEEFCSLFPGLFRCFLKTVSPR